MPLRAIYYDTETTGIRPDKDRIVELAAYDPVNDRSFVKLINPGCPIPKEAMAIHKITDEMVANAPTFTEVIQEFTDFCHGESVLIAHNNDSFDAMFLKQEFNRSQSPMPSWKFLDTLKWARKYRPDLPRHTLQSLREVYGIPSNTAHRALDDVITLYKVFSSMIDDLSLEIVCELLSKPTESPVMPFGKYQGKSFEEVPKDYISWLSKSGAFDKPENLPLRQQFEKLGML